MRVPLLKGSIAKCKTIHFEINVKSSMNKVNTVLKQFFAKSEEILGSDYYPDTLSSLNNLVILYEKQYHE